MSFVLYWRNLFFGRYDIYLLKINATVTAINWRMRQDVRTGGI